MLRFPPHATAPEALPLDVRGTIADLAVGKNGGMTVLETVGDGGETPLLRSFDAGGRPLGFWHLAEEGASALTMSPDGPVALEHPAGQWMPVALRGTNLTAAMQRVRGRAGLVLPDGDELVSQREGDEVRIALAGPYGMRRSWRITSRTPLGEIQLARRWGAPCSLCSASIPTTGTSSRCSSSTTSASRVGFRSGRARLGGDGPARPASAAGVVALRARLDPCRRLRRPLRPGGDPMSVADDLPHALRRGVGTVAYAALVGRERLGLPHEVRREQLQSNAPQFTSYFTRDGSIHGRALRPLGGLPVGRAAAGTTTITTIRRAIRPPIPAPAGKEATARGSRSRSGASR